jgi:hypothetical protein
MPTAGEYRAQAKECMELANATNEFYVRTALNELARKFSRRARQAERRERDMVVGFANLQPSSR